MTAITFDTLQFVEQLTAAGVTEAHAKAEASAFREIFAQAINTTVATKSDIARLESSTKSDIARLESSTKSDIARLESSTKSDIARLENSTKSDIARLESNIEKMELRMTIKLGALIAAAVGILIAVLRVPHLI